VSQPQAILGLKYHNYRTITEETTGTPIGITVGKIIDTALSQV
jgi:hypothetical protein